MGLVGGISKEITSLSAQQASEARLCTQKYLKELLEVILKDGDVNLAPDARHTDVPARYPETDTTRVRSFRFETPPNEYKGGSRQWLRIASDLWEQIYPDGTKQLNHVVGRIRVDGCDGTVVSGKPDLDFQAFFPDRNCDDKEFMFRRLSQGTQWHAYVQIDQMK